MACHILGAPNMALNLSKRPPTSVECISKEGNSSFMFPKKVVLRFDFPAYGSMPPLKLFWYDALKEQPKIPGVAEGEYLGDMPSPGRPQGQQGQQGQGQGQGRGARGGRGGGQAGPPAPRNEGTGRVFTWAQQQALKENPPTRSTPDGSLFIGDKGMITTGTYGEQTRLIPVEKMENYNFPQPVLSRSPGHYHDWIRACKGGEPACSNFSVAGPFVEWMVLGVIACRVEGKLEWDSAKMRFTNNAEANKNIRPFNRKGWAPNWKG
jgi:hypothetical protein